LSLPLRPPFLCQATIAETNLSTRDILALTDDDVLSDPMKPPPSSFRGRSDIDEFSDPFALPEFSELLKKPTAPNPIFSESTARLLSRLGDEQTPGPKAKCGTRKQTDTSLKSTAVEVLSDDNIDEPVAPRKTAKKTSKVTTVEKEAKAKAREEAKLQRERERELEKERKLKLKEEKAKEKQRAADIASVNKTESRTKRIPHQR
jgi:hypothetical protein